MESQNKQGRYSGKWIDRERERARTDDKQEDGDWGCGASSQNYWLTYSGAINCVQVEIISLLIEYRDIESQPGEAMQSSSGND